MAGRHEPPSRTSFYLSVATAALRAVLVVAALALGVFILSKMLPTGGPGPAAPGEGAVQTEEPPAEEPAAEETTAPQPGKTAQPRDPSKVEVQVLNATGISGLASDTAEILEAQGYKIVTVDDAEGEHDRTTIFYHPKSKADAEVLKQNYFPMAALEESAPDTEVAITVVLSQDYADQQEGGGTEETPSE